MHLAIGAINVERCSTKQQKSHNLWSLALAPDAAVTEVAGIVWVAGTAMGAACGGGPLGLAAGRPLHRWNCHLWLSSLQIYPAGTWHPSSLLWWEQCITSLSMKNTCTFICCCFGFCSFCLALSKTG